MSGCRSALQKISESENLTLRMLEFNISMGQVFLGNNYDSGHELNDDEEIIKAKSLPQRLRGITWRPYTFRKEILAKPQNIYSKA